MKYKIINVCILGLMTLILACSSSTESKNSAGEIINIFMPDSLVLPEDVSYALVRAQVDDPDGLDDIAAVYFYSQKPNGEWANSGLPIHMVNDGTFGDEIAGDDIYSMGIQINSENQLGVYVFTFRMEDKAGNLSVTVVDSIKVYE